MMNIHLNGAMLSPQVIRWATDEMKKSGTIKDVTRVVASCDAACQWESSGASIVQIKGESVLAGQSTMGGWPLEAKVGLTSNQIDFLDQFDAVILRINNIGRVAINQFIGMVINA